MHVNLILSRWSSRLGVLGVWGAGVMAFSAVFLLSAVLPLKQQVAELDVQYQALKRHKPNGATIERARQQNTQEKLAAFYESFPQERAIAELLNKIHSAAAAANVTLSKGEYRMVLAPSEKLGRYQMSFPLQGSYRDIQRFLADVTESMPAAAIDEVSFRRKDATSSQVDCAVRFSLYLKAS
jgi:Tfp pilus assembly protein PilO